MSCMIHDLVEDKKGRTVATLFGTWEESLHYVIGGNSGKGKESSYVSSKPHVLWKRSPTPEYQTRYNLTQFAITLNEITPGLKEKLPPTDSRLRPDQRCLENGQHEMTNFGKLRLEQSQRHERCKRRVGNQGGLPRKKAATLTVILEGTGRPGKRGTGNLVLTFLAKSQPILILTQLHKFSTLKQWFLLLPQQGNFPFPNSIWQQHQFFLLSDTHFKVGSIEWMEWSFV
ncbi:Oxysterol-binding protein-related protein 1C [Glycine soja]|uniref:Oxysterol-binding protein-related protein 1C n=1 Tax=Glycine soja TaxID=3848 RepID=A0A0B2P2G5_GLYSO|nr:Oxysterol-binding protein-related protein 1C [Glycine soja]